MDGKHERLRSRLKLKYYRKKQKFLKSYFTLLNLNSNYTWLFGLLINSFVKKKWWKIVKNLYLKFPESKVTYLKHLVLSDRQSQKYWNQYKWHLWGVFGQMDLEMRAITKSCYWVFSLHFCTKHRLEPLKAGCVCHIWQLPQPVALSSAVCCLWN